MLEIVDRNFATYDAVVVGSGATGGWAAKLLSEAGMTVAVVEAGQPVTPSDFTEHIHPYELKYRGYSPFIARHRAIQSLKYACRESNYHWFVNDIENPYTASPDKPFQWTRCRILGGRTMTWGRQSYRFSDLDFKAASRDGHGEDWPISYDDLMPYYEKVERYIGISGAAENLPQLPDSIFLPPMKMTSAERYFANAVKSKLGHTVTIGRTAMLTRNHNGRTACHHCGPCEQGCMTFSYFNSPFTTIKDAIETGRADIFTNSVASHITRDPKTGLASGIAYIDRLTRAPREIRAKVVVLCASSLESVRLLLNSGPEFANSSGLVGHYIMDHASSGISGVLPLKEANRWFGPPRRPNGIYIPRFHNLDRKHTNGTIRGYGYQGSADNAQFSVEKLSKLPGFGRSFKESIHNDREIRLGLGSFVECLPRYENFVALDKDLVDAWGIPALRMNVAWSDNEYNLIKSAADHGQEMMAAAGAKDIKVSSEISIPGGKTHEVGGARMGNNPKSSVINRYNQTHDIRNLFVADGAAFVSSACQNPTLTLMALAARTCDHIIEFHSKGELG